MSLEKFQKAFRSSISIISAALLFITYSGTAQPIAISIQQGKQVYDLLEIDSLVLKPRPFKYLVQFPTGKDIKLHHAFTDSLYKAFKEQKVERITHWGARCMAEASFNSDKEILLASRSWSCWFYDETLDFHRLDAKSIREKSGVTMGRKSVIALYDVKNKTTTSLRKAIQPIYLVIAFEAEEHDKVAYAHCCKIIFED